MKTNISNDVELNQILYMKRLGLTPHQVSELTGKKKSEIDRVFSAKGLIKKKSKKFDLENYLKSTPTL